MNTSEFMTLFSYQSKVNTNERDLNTVPYGNIARVLLAGIWEEIVF
jgi:hypothetical protein